MVNPFKEFDNWYEKAKLVHDEEEYNAISLATINAKNTPSVRIVLLKYYDQSGMVFFTNKNSNKAKDIKLNPYVAGCFYWPKIGIQIRIQGSIEEIPAQESDDYFDTRLRERQIGAWASAQSSILPNEAELDKRIKELTERFKGKSILRPPFWGGYKIIPDIFEIWQKRENRLNKRDHYEKVNGEWIHQLLYP